MNPNWKHATREWADNEKPVGCDLFDDEQHGFVTIYQRFADGTRIGARSVKKCFDHEHYTNVMCAWLKDGVNYDYRKSTEGDSHLILDRISKSPSQVDADLAETDLK